MSKLQQHFMKEHDLMLLDSEVHDILELARQEIELPTQEEIEQQFPTKRIEDIPNKENLTSNQIYHIENCNMLSRQTHKDIQEGVWWALKKVRNPYPKPM